jgi:hypothetical protein
MTQKGKKPFKTENLRIIEEFAEDTPEARQHLEDGLRILAHMIARVYLKDLEKKRQADLMNPNDSVKDIVTCNSPTNGSDIWLDEIYESD